MSGREFLPYGRQCIEADDVAAVVAALKGEWLTTGPRIADFEAALSRRLDVPFATVCANGTAALHLAMLSLGVAEEDVVIVPAMTFLATANAARYVGAEVLFCDVDADSGLIKPEHLADALGKLKGKRAKAVASVHLNGQTDDPVAIGHLADEHGLAVVEDACHAIGTDYRDGSGVAHRVGACRHSTMAAFSFHAVKTVTSAEGGAVTTRDRNLHDRLQLQRNHGMMRGPNASFSNETLAWAADGSANPWYYEMSEPGFNYRLTDVQCALGISQLAKLDQFKARRKALVERYDRALAPLAPIVRPVPRTDKCDAAWHLYAVLTDFNTLGRDRASVMNELRERGIGTQVHYVPVNRQPYYRDRYGTELLPGAEAYYARILSLPLYPALRDADVDYVVENIARIVERG